MLPSRVPSYLILVGLSLACLSGIPHLRKLNPSEDVAVHWLANGSKVKPKPSFIIHLGPTKTATTTIQVGLTDFQDTLAEDNYAYVGKYMPGGPGVPIRDRMLEIMLDTECHEEVNKARLAGEKERPECWKQFLEILEIYREQGTSIIMSDEGFSFSRADLEDIGRNPIDWVALKEDLGEDWDILTIVAYRRLTDWIPSARQQRDRWGPRRTKSSVMKWPPKGKALGPLFPDVLDWPPVSGKKPKKMQWFYYDSDAVVEMLEPHVPYRIFNMYAKESIRTNFMCNMLPNAPRSCQASVEKDKAEPDTHFNAEQSLYYDALATAAVEQSLLEDYKDYIRHDVATAIQVHQESKLNMTALDFPTRCPSKYQLEILLEASLKKEAKLMPGMSEQEHRDAFWKNVAKGKYCWIDTDMVLEMDEWKNFFEKLTPEVAHQVAGSNLKSFFGFPVERRSKKPKKKHSSKE